MSSLILDTVFIKVREALQSLYPDMTFYKYDPRARNYQRPFATVQPRGIETNNLPTRTIGNAARRYRFDIIIGLKEGEPEEVEEALAMASQAVIDMFEPWSSILANVFVEDIYSMQEPENVSRLRDTVTLKLSVIST